MIADLKGTIAAKKIDVSFQELQKDNNSRSYVYLLYLYPGLEEERMTALDSEVT